jgi:hypothetical protein
VKTDYYVLDTGRVTAGVLREEQRERVQTLRRVPHHAC